MRVLYEHPVLPRALLASGLSDAVEELRIVHVPLDLEDVSRIWSTFKHPYRTSTTYEVSVVQLDRLDDQGSRCQRACARSACRPSTPRCIRRS